MNIESFQVFCDVVETTSFSQAGERNGISQSAVSQQISNLEKSYGVTLIERGRRHFAMTPEGELFLRSAREILDTYRGIGRRLKAMQDEVAGPLVVATVYSIGFHELPPYLEKFRRAFPEVDLQVQYRRSNEVYADVLESRSDLGLVAYPQNRKGIEIEPVWRDRLVLICPPQHHFSRMKSVPLKMINDERFVSFEPDLPTRKALDAMFRKGGVTVREVVEFDNIETVKRGVVIENAISIVPGGSVRAEIEAGNLCRIEIEDQNVWRPLGVIRRRTKSVSPAIRELVATLKSTL